MYICMCISCILCASRDRLITRANSKSCLCLDNNYHFLQYLETIIVSCEGCLVTPPRNLPYNFDFVLGLSCDVVTWTSHDHHMILWASPIYMPRPVGSGQRGEKRERSRETETETSGD